MDKRTEQERIEAHKRKVANLVPFKKENALTEEERQKQHDIVVKGGIARGEQVKKAKSMKEQALTLLNTKLSRKEAERLIGDKAELIEDTDLNVQSVLMVRAFMALLEDGNIKSAEFLRDTSGQKPKEEIAIDGNVIMTEADRRLLDNLSRRLKSN